MGVVVKFLKTEPPLKNPAYAPAALTCGGAGVDAGCCPDNAPECDLGECRYDFLCNELQICCPDVPATGTYTCSKSITSSTTSHLLLYY